MLNPIYANLCNASLSEPYRQLEANQETSIYQPSTLWEYYTQLEGSLPSIAERAEVFALVSPLEKYWGEKEQNIELLDFLLSASTEQEIPINYNQPREEIFGGAGGSSELPLVTANFESSLVSRIEKTDLEMELVDSVDQDGVTLSGWYGFTIDITSSKRETVIASCAGSSCSQMLRGVSYSDGISTSSDRAFIHRRGADVSITNHPNLTIITNILNGVDGIPDKIYYDDGVTINSGDDEKTLVDLDYVNALIAQGVATTTQTVFGGGTEATQDQIKNQYYDINDPRLLTTRYTSPGNNSTTSIIVSEEDGFLNQDRIDLSEDFVFTGDTTIGSTTITASTTWNILPEYDTDPVGDDEAVRKSYVDTFISAFSSGIFSTSTPGDLGTANIAHGLGAKPRLVKFTAIHSSGEGNGVTPSTSFGSITNSTTQYIGFEAQAGSSPDRLSGAGNVGGTVLRLETGSDSATASSTLDAINIQLEFTTFDGTRSVQVLWEAYK